MRFRGCELNIVTSAGRLREHLRSADGHHYVCGKPDLPYFIRLSNHTQRRILAVVSVDGKNVIDAKAATSDGSGYILDPGEKLDIPGWRLNSKGVAAFVFGTPSESYAVQSGDGDGNLGVIGAALWTEAAPQVEPTSYSKSGRRGPGGQSAFGESDRLLCSTGKTLSFDESPTERGLGTQFGEKLGYDTQAVNFQRGLRFVTLVLRYNDAANLRKMGIEVTEPGSGPNPFPADRAETGCEPPAGWTG